MESNEFLSFDFEVFGKVQGRNSSFFIFFKKNIKEFIFVNVLSLKQMS